MVKSRSPGSTKLTGKFKSNAPSLPGKKSPSSALAPAHDDAHSKVQSRAKVKSPASQKKATSGSSRGFSDAHGEAVCREVACEGLATSGGYCRLHYIKNWKKIKRKEVILREKKLNQYIEELVVKYPDKYIEAIRQDLASDKDFAKVIYDLDLDEAVDDFDAESAESADSLIDTIKRDFEDDPDAF
jgi:hypothetical protein